MDVSTISQLIASVGFPIAMCIYLMLSNDKLREVIAENTMAITELKHMIEQLKDRLE